MFRWGAALVLLVGCGRVAFDAPGGDGGPDASLADAFVGTWTVEQHVENETDNTISWVQDTRAGSLLVVAFNLPPGTTITGLFDQADNTFTRIDDASATNFQGPLEMWSAMNTADVSGDIAFAYIGPTPNAQVAWEVSGLTGQIDAVAALSDQATTATPTSPPLTTTAPGDFIVAIVKTDVIETLASPEYTLDSLIRDDGYAHLTENDAPAGTYQTSWTSQPSMYCASSVAFRSK